MSYQHFYRIIPTSFVTYHLSRYNGGMLISPEMEQHLTQRDITLHLYVFLYDCMYDRHSYNNNVMFITYLACYVTFVANII